MQGFKFALAPLRFDLMIKEEITAVSTLRLHYAKG